MECKQVLKHKTVDELLTCSNSDKFIIDQQNGKPRIFRNGKDISVKKKPEMYLNEGESLDLMLVLLIGKL